MAEASNNNRVSQFTAEGEFVRAWGWDVVSSGPGNDVTGTPNEFEICVAADGDVCKAGATGGAAGQLTNPTGVAVDQSSGFVYVTSQFSRRVDVFSGTGQFAGAFGWDVDPAGVVGPEICTTVTGCKAAGTAGGDAGRFGALTTSIPAVDPNVEGRVYVPDPGNLRVAHYETTIVGGTLTSASFVKAFGWDVDPAGGTGLESCTTACKAGVAGAGAGQFTTQSPSAVAVDSSGAIYATSGPTFGNCTATAPCRIQKFAPDAGSATDFGPPAEPGRLRFEAGTAQTVAPFSVAIDPADDHVFVQRRATSNSYQVLEYDSAGNYIETHPAGNALPTTSPNNNSAGLAVGAGDRVYANLGGPGTSQVFILGPVDPPTVTIDPVTDVGTSTATFNGTVTIPAPGSPTFDTKYRFEYSSNGVDWTNVPSTDANVGDGSTGIHTVTQQVTGLDPNTLYSVRLVATTGSTVTSNTVSFTTDPAPPRVALTFVDDVTQTSARLGAHIDPEGNTTSYHFEWGDQPCSSNPDACARVPGFERQLGSDNQVLIANEPIGGLRPATTYHYRLVATNAAGTTVGPDERFETLNDCNLTGGRCYELVSPADKGPVAAGGDLVALAQDLRFQAAEDRPSVAFTLAYGLPDGTAGDEAVFQASRTASGWSSEQLEAPALVQRESPGNSSNTSFAKGLSRNLDCGVFSSYQPLGEDPPTDALQAGAVALYARHVGGLWAAVTDSVPANPLSAAGRGLTEFDLIGVSEDDPCARVVFQTQYVYPGVDGAGSPRLYWSEGGVLGYVGVIPGPCVGGACVAAAVPGAPYTNPALDLTRNFQRAVSEDGSQVLFTAISQQGGDAGRQAVFLRDLDSPVAVDVSQSQTGSLPGGTANDDDATYQTASVDGAKVFFTGRYGLASDATGDAVHSSTGVDACASANNEDGRGCDLYEYDVASGKLTDLSVPHPGMSNAAGASVAGVLAADEDGSHVYFAARGKLAPGDGATEGRNLAEDTFNVYLARGGSLSYVGRIEENVAGAGGVQLVRFANTSGTSPLPRWTSRVSADGRRLLFQSRENLTDYDSRGEPSAYLFDAQTGETVCVSCRRDGGPPTVAPPGGIGSTFFNDPLLAGEHTQTLTTAPRTLSDDGRRVFFVSLDALATGGTQGRPNLYQWEEGQVSFIASSAPNSTIFNLRFGGASADGDDVYFATVDKYTWQDRDPKLDVYDARVGGGFAAPPPPAAPCDPLTGGDCQPGRGAPVIASPLETSKDGAGNAPPAERLNLAVGGLSARQRRALAAGRRVKVRIRVSGAGKVSVRGIARIGGFGVTVLSASHRASRAGLMKVPVRLSRAARRRTAAGHLLKVRFTVSLDGARRAYTRSLRLKAGPVAKKRRVNTRTAVRSRAATTTGRAGK